MKQCIVLELAVPAQTEPIEHSNTNIPTRFQFTICESFRNNDIFQHEDILHIHYELLHVTNDYTQAKNWIHSFITSLLFINGYPINTHYKTLQYFSYLVDINNFYFSAAILEESKNAFPEMFI